MHTFQLSEAVKGKEPACLLACLPACEMDLCRERDSAGDEEWSRRVGLE